MQALSRQRISFFAGSSVTLLYARRPVRHTLWETTADVGGPDDAEAISGVHGDVLADGSLQVILDSGT